jgi:hypothetical protein
VTSGPCCSRRNTTQGNDSLIKHLRRVMKLRIVHVCKPARPSDNGSARWMHTLRRSKHCVASSTDCRSSHSVGSSALAAFAIFRSRLGPESNHTCCFLLLVMALRDQAWPSAGLQQLCSASVPDLLAAQSRLTTLHTRNNPFDSHALYQSCWSS